MPKQNELKRLNITFPEFDAVLHRRLKLIARAKDMNITDAVLEAIGEWVRHNASILTDEERKISA